MKNRKLSEYLHNPYILSRKIIGVSLFIFMFTTLTIWIGDAADAQSFGDPFDGNDLNNSNWKWQNEPSEWDVGGTLDGHLYIMTDDADRNLWANDMSHFLYQETETDMFDVETQFNVRWDTNSSVLGLVVKSPGNVEDDTDDNWVTLKFWARDAGNRGQIQFQRKQSGMGPADIGWRFGDWGDIQLSLRLKKEGDTYTAWYKAEEDEDWVDIGQGTFTLTSPLWLGIYAGVGNAEGGTLEVEYDYLQDNLNQFPVEPDGKATTTWGAVKTRY